MGEVGDVRIVSGMAVALRRSEAVRKEAGLMVARLEKHRELLAEAVNLAASTVLLQSITGGKVAAAAAEAVEAVEYLGAVMADTVDALKRTESRAVEAARLARKAERERQIAAGEGIWRRGPAGKAITAASDD